MSESFFKAKTAQRVPLRSEQYKIIFQYTMMLAASLGAGVAFTYFLGNEFLSQIAQRVSVHFEMPFADCTNASDVICTVLYDSMPEWICTFILLISSLTVVHYIISDLVLVYKGFQTGFSVALLCQMRKTDVGYHPGTGHFWVFLLLKGVLLIGFGLYAYRLAFSAYDLKQIGESGRITLNLRTFCVLLLGTVAFIGFVLLVNGSYAALIFLLKK